jgi:4-amino-4-deoxy-L-arabinose transferase-like glycosyltransferase
VYITIVVVFLLLRVALVTYFILIEGQYLVPDSLIYIDLAKNLVEHHVFSSSLQAPFNPNFFRTPGYPFFLALCEYLGFGKPYWVIFWQELIYCFSLWLFYRFSPPLFGKKITQLTVLFLLIEPGGLTFPMLYYSEVIFLPFFILGLLFIGYYLNKDNWHYLVLSGLFMGIGIIIRPALQYFPIIIALSIISFNFRNRQHWLHSGLLLLIVALTLSPWLAHNYLHSGKIFLSGQQNNMFANYHVPRVWAVTKNISFSEGQKIIKRKVNASIDQKEKQQGHPLTEVEIFGVQKEVALIELKKHPYVYSKQWVVGALRAMVGLHLPTLKSSLKIKKDAPYLNDIKEHTFVFKIWEFIKQQPIHIIFLLIIRGMLAFFALLGAIAIIQSKNRFMWILMLANFYFICIAGPMADSRFRFPVESFWFIQSYYGFIWIIHTWLNKSKSKFKIECLVTLKAHLPITHDLNLK